MIDRLEKCGLIPVVKIKSPDIAVPFSRALLDGGVDVIEITFRTNAAAAAIRNVVSEVPEMLVGAGTVVTPEQFEAAREAGAKFIVSPGLDPDIVKLAQEHGIPVFPGAVTPSEIQTGLKLGLSVFKFFPASNYGGLETIKALSAPFGNIHFIPTGGINVSNAGSYWSSDKVLAVGGSWIAPSDLIDSGNFAAITRLTKEAVDLMKKARAEAKCSV